MATTKKTTAKKETAKKVGNETKIVCPVCGSEFAIGEHEHTVKNATVIGQDSGLGTVYLNVSKRGEALRAAGIDTGKYFSITLPTGGSQLMRMDDAGRAVPVTPDDPILKAIVEGGTVPNRSLFRRWIMSQVFHGLQHRGGFSTWLRYHGYDYQWTMLIEELRVQDKLHTRGDAENFRSRNRWFNEVLAYAMANDYIEQLRRDLSSRKTRRCKGVPYITVGRQNIFVSDIDRKIITPLVDKAMSIKYLRNGSLCKAVREFFSAMPEHGVNYAQFADWKDAYKGMGAYATMQNLLRFHGCTFPRDNDFYKRGKSGLEMLEDAAHHYAVGDGWRLFGLMKQMLDENHIDIDAKFRQWAQDKRMRTA